MLVANTAPSTPERYQRPNNYTSCTSGGQEIHEPNTHSHDNEKLPHSAAPSSFRQQNQGIPNSDETGNGQTTTNLEHHERFQNNLCHLLILFKAISMIYNVSFETVTRLAEDLKRNGKEVDRKTLIEECEPYEKNSHSSDTRQDLKGNPHESGIAVKSSQDSAFSSPPSHHHHHIATDSGLPPSATVYSDFTSLDERSDRDNSDNDLSVYQSNDSSSSNPERPNSEMDHRGGDSTDGCDNLHFNDGLGSSLQHYDSVPRVNTHHCSSEDMLSHALPEASIRRSLQDTSEDKSHNCLNIEVENTLEVEQKPNKRYGSLAGVEFMKISCRLVQQEHAILEKNRLCRLCRQKSRDITFLPCGHFITCRDCAEPIDTCPACDKSILATVDTYLS